MVWCAVSGVAPFVHLGRAQHGGRGERELRGEHRGKGGRSSQGGRPSFLCAKRSFRGVPGYVRMRARVVRGGKRPEGSILEHCVRPGARRRAPRRSRGRSTAVLVGFAVL